MCCTHRTSSLPCEGNARYHGGVSPPTRLFAVILALLMPMTSLRAQPAADDPDIEIARRRFKVGMQFYADQNYEKALAEFEAARRVMPAPGLDYNIARCFDRLERYEDAIREYEKYLQQQPNAADSASTRERVAKLRARVTTPVTKPEPKPEPKPDPKPEPHVTPSTTPPAPPPAPTATVAVTAPAPASKPSYTPAIAVGVTAGVLAVVGAGLLGHVGSRVNDLERECGTACAPKRVDPLRQQAVAGYAMMGLAVTALIVDVALIAVTASKRSKPRVSLLPDWRNLSHQ